MNEAGYDRDRSRKKKIGILIVSIFVLLLILAGYYICVPMLKMADDPEMFRIYMRERGFAGVLIFIGVTILQVIAAVIPGGPFEIAAGYSFGVLWGTVICDIGMTVGSMIVFLLVRKFGMDFIELFFSKEKVESSGILKTTDGLTRVIFMLYVIPGTPKDVLSYAVGLTDMKLTTWLFITSVGRLPAILLSVIGGSSLGDRRYGIFIISMIVILVAGAAGGLLYGRWRKKQN